MSITFQVFFNYIFNHFFVKGQRKILKVFNVYPLIGSNKYCKKKQFRFRTKYLLALFALTNVNKN